jgi:hypothetical protein
MCRSSTDSADVDGARCDHREELGDIEVVTLGDKPFGVASVARAI